MDSRDKQIGPHQPLLSSLVVRPSETGGEGVGGRTDYETGEVRDDRAPYSRHERYPDEHGDKTWAHSGSPIHRREVGHRYSPDIDKQGDLRRRGFQSDMDALRYPGRYRDSPTSHYRRGARPFRRAFEDRGLGPGLLRGDALQRNNPNVRPRDGDWYCPDPRCGNLNFARREHCNSCGKYRNAPVGSPRRGHGGPAPPFGGPRRFPAPPMERSPGRFTNGYRSPSHGWPRDGPRDFGPSIMPHPRHEGRFSDHHARRDRLDYPDEDVRGSDFDRLAPPDWASRERAKDHIIDDRKGHERRIPSPLLLPPPPPPHPAHRGRRVEHDMRERSRSPIVGPPKDFHRNLFVERNRDERRGGERDRVGRVY
ncbi:hypothetical protein Dimus_026542 [Dionaea muscipula]